ncbi:all3515 family Zur-repressed PEP-CTERM protein [Nitrosomonas marina]|uniref:PEP-CTERM protein-sorting domain-containing protein n=1 Tax=Nitrosomonas marina TaxID=917 RepID=A0A1H8DDI5_9PROT|nr:all3515 family Zur-repressed PEP-CTERM protein [Nitrosomonas marina]SEN04638.1 PEP-CTERM protein-sorting domain-containing protein [Nitrosomonas marina]
MIKIDSESKLLSLRWCCTVIAMGFLLLSSARIHAYTINTEYFIGVDGLSTIGSGVYAGLSNPNAGRLTFLFGHPNDGQPSLSHYHSIGAYSYSGPPDNPSINPTNVNNRLPETYSGQAPLPLSSGTGVHSGRLISQALPDLEYSNLQMQSTQSLDGFAAGTTEDYLFHSSGNRWSGALDGAMVGLQLVSITNGLYIANELGDTILASLNDVYNLGSGNNLLFTPTFFTASNAADGIYSASFRLVDLNGSLHESGIFNFDFQVSRQVSEPVTLLLLFAGLVGILIVRTFGFSSFSSYNIKVN